MKPETDILVLCNWLNAAQAKAQIDKVTAWQDINEIISHYAELKGSSSNLIRDVFEALDLAILCKDEAFVESLQLALLALESDPKRQQDIENYIRRKRQELKTPKELNILILGKTGVGKSTWINAFANYINYASLDDAVKGDLISLIPSSFIITNRETFEEQRILIGQDTNECFVDGQSATQHPRAYLLSKGKLMIRLIDTPGIGDVRGIEQDRTNVANILAFLSNYDQVHGICVLLKPNEARLDVMFQFCIKEILTHLHRSAAQNIVFCFTNARNTHYTPGDTIRPLKVLVEENKDIGLTVSKDTMYCMDSESFRYLAGRKNNYPFDERDFHDYSMSWDRSVEEVARLLKHIASLKPHKVKDTITLNDARRLIVELTRPIAEITQLIQANITVLKESKEELSSSKKTTKELVEEKLYIPSFEIEATQLGYPRTVCTSPSCTQVIKQSNGQQIVHYKQHCHPRCTLDRTDTVGDPALQNCSAMQNGQCTKCGCSWRKHMHITYETFMKPVQVIDPNTKVRIDTEEERQRAIQEHIQTLDTRIKEYRQEQEIITKASAKFACFLKQNAIAPYNDALADYLDHLIDNCQQIVDVGEEIGGETRKENLSGLQKMKREYAEQVKILENAMSQGGSQAKITPDDIKALEQELLNLELTGEALRQVITQAKAAKSKSVAYGERRVPVQHPQRSDGFISDLTNAVTKRARTLWDMLDALL
jgi:predicted GTPase